MSLHKEISFETEICEHLAAHGWLYAEGDAAGYDRARALFPADVLAWVQATQPTAWDTLAKNHGSKAEETLLGRLRDQLDQRGTLDVLRHGVELLGLKTPLSLAQFKPALAINPDILARHAANRLRVVRQLRYSLHNENNIDLVLFLNGLPVATAELKTNFTQNISDAIWQYKTDRLPRPKGQAAEPLLSFPNGALVHFAVSNSEVAMVTQLNGPATQFLPFNQGNEGAADNPVNAAGGQTDAAVERRRGDNAGAHHRGRQRHGAGAAEGLYGRVDRKAQRTVRQRNHRQRPVELRERHHLRQGGGVRHPQAAGGQQHQGAVRQLTGSENRVAERHHGVLRRAHVHEHPGTELAGGSARHPQYPAEPLAALRNLAGAGRGISSGRFAINFIAVDACGTRAGGQKCFKLQRHQERRNGELPFGIILKNNKTFFNN